MAEQRRKARWMMPHKRAKGYAQERKAKVHQRGKKEGQDLSEYDKGFRSGYLFCQTDHAEAYKWSQAKKGAASDSAASDSAEGTKAKGGKKKS